MKSAPLRSGSQKSGEPDVLPARLSQGVRGLVTRNRYAIPLYLVAFALLAVVLRSHPPEQTSPPPSTDVKSMQLPLPKKNFVSQPLPFMRMGGYDPAEQIGDYRLISWGISEATSHPTYLESLAVELLNSERGTVSRGGNLRGSVDFLGGRSSGGR